MRNEKSTDRSAPVAIGGVGGSGTRLIAQVLMDLGFYMGGDLNESNDNLWFTLLFKRPEILSLTERELRELLNLFVGRMTGAACSPAQTEWIRRLAAYDRPQHPADWLRDRADSLLRAGAVGTDPAQWGWKEPNTHVVLDRLQAALPAMKYIHVMRNGLDMAHSINQNQLRLWGTQFIGREYEISPYFSLRFWCTVHRRVLALGESMPERFLLLNYDRFCLHPQDGIGKLLDFLDVAPSAADVARLAHLVRAPSSIGRYKKHGLDLFDPADVAFVAHLGFDTQA